MYTALKSSESETEILIVVSVTFIVKSYVLSATARLDEWIVERNDREEWMHHRQLPHGLRESIRKHDRYTWVATQGIDEEGLLQGLPPDVRRQIKRHLCLDLVLRVSHVLYIHERQFFMISVLLESSSNIEL